MDLTPVIAALDVVARELAMFACFGFVVGGIDDFAIDAIFFAKRRWQRLPTGKTEHRLALFVPAWDEAQVIGPMLTATLARSDHPDYRVYVGCYASDPATIAAAAAIAADDARVRLAINVAPGPTTKGDNLNSLWRALLRDEAIEDWHADAIVLHDAEDLVHPAAFRVFDLLLAQYALIQLPVLPLIHPRSRWVSAHYADEFAESHMRSLVARHATGAALPLAGVGCALRRDALDRVADARGGAPFDAASLTEDYELGLAIAGVGGRGCFARYRDATDMPIATRAFFPDSLPAAARQKARWIAGIALLGWDRLGWGGRFRPGEAWMRMRDRRGPLAVFVLATGYLALATGALVAGLHLASGTPPPRPAPVLAGMLVVSSLLLIWRTTNRAATTTAYYGWREGLRAIPRTVVGNLVALWATCRAVSLYHASLCGRALRWDKTAHVFPLHAAR